MATSLDNHYLSVPIGADATGAPVLVDLTEHTLVVGSPGSGVGNTIQGLIRGVADKPYVELLGIDPYFDLAPWKPRFSSIAKMDQDAVTMLGNLEARFASTATTVLDAVTLLSDLEARFEARATMLARTASKRIAFASMPPSDEVPFIVVVIPELGMLPAEAQQMVNHLVARGRFAGIFFIVGGMQAIVENPLLRNLIGNRIAHALQTETATQRVFGEPAGRVEPHLLDPIQDRGVGYLDTVGGTSRFTAPHIDHIAAQAFAVMTRPLIPKSLI